LPWPRTIPGGIVIAQVERIAERGTLNSRQVKIPGLLVNCVVVAEKPEYHMQTFIEQYNPAFSGEIRVPMSSSARSMPMSERKIIARRAALELKRQRGGKSRNRHARRHRLGRSRREGHRSC
jgi:propionate CoA-transferase